MTAPTQTRVGAYVFHQAIKKRPGPVENNSTEPDAGGLYGFHRYAVPSRDGLIVDQAFQHPHFVLEHFKIAHGFLHVLQFHRHGT